MVPFSLEVPKYFPSRSLVPSPFRSFPLGIQQYLPKYMYLHVHTLFVWAPSPPLEEYVYARYNIVHGVEQENL